MHPRTRHYKKQVNERETTQNAPKAHDGEMPQHVREKEEHDGRVDQLVQERAEERGPPGVTVAVGDHSHAEHGAASEHEADGDEDIERVHQELERRGEHDPHLMKTRGGGVNERHKSRVSGRPSVWPLPLSRVVEA